MENKFRERITSRYPAVGSSDMPTNYDLRPLDYEREKISKLHVIFWHRLLRSLYNEPIEIECDFYNNSLEEKVEVRTETIRKTKGENTWEIICSDEIFVSEIESGKLKPIPVNWKYLVKLPSGGIVELGTRDRSTIFYIAQVATNAKHVNIGKEAKNFISQLLDEANRVGRQLFNPTNEFNKLEDVKLYFLLNVYLSNYSSANTMLNISESQEMILADQFLKYDARTTDYNDTEKKEHIDKSLLTCGTFYCSAMAYYFMALEGFINIVFHAFLKQRYRHKDFALDQRLDIEQKLRFMPTLCKGFNDDDDIPQSIILGFKSLKKYRNSLFHSKVEDSLKSMVFVEEGFVYNYNIDEQKDVGQSFPSLKAKLTDNDVVYFKSTVDEVINYILESMNQDTRKVTESYILAAPHIPFYVSKNGELAIGDKVQN